MEPLIKITTIPIALEMKINHARLEYNNASAELEISRDKGGLRIKSSPIKLHLDTFEARSSIRPSAKQSIEQYAEKGRAAAYEATATYAREGHLLLEAKFGQDVLGQIIANHTDVFAQPAETNYNIDFIPKGGADISFEEGNLTIDYQLDKLNFDWKTQQGDFEFIPGDIEITVAQRPEVRIEYVGEPLYVPRSADPNYEPIDVKA